MKQGLVPEHSHVSPKAALLADDEIRTRFDFAIVGMIPAFVCLKRIFPLVDSNTPCIHPYSLLRC